MKMAMSEPTQSAPFPDFGHLETLRSLASRDRQLDLAGHISSPHTSSPPFVLEAAGWRLDTSRHLMRRDSLDELARWANTAGALEAREALFDGRPINHTEDRAVLHTLLRADAPFENLQQEYSAVHACLQRMERWVDRVHSGDHRGHSDKVITDVVNIGIGGSDLGPRMVTAALKPFHVETCRVHYCANVDPDDLTDTLSSLSADSTLFIICSKTLTTEETLYNAARARQWLLDSGVAEASLGRHLLAVSTNLSGAEELGIPAENVLPMWDWVGGRYSLWSAIGWSIAFAIGMPSFRTLLSGARDMDAHFRDSSALDSLPLRLSLLEIWYVNFMASQVHAVIPYHQHLQHLPAFLQQLSMESNGKQVNHQGQHLEYATAPILWGDVGTNGQHSFHQLLHQGTTLCPIDFILFTGCDNGEGAAAETEGKRRLLANGLSQARALALGRNEAASLASLETRGAGKERAVELAAHLTIPGNRPSSVLIAESLTPYTLGSLIALYEHKVFFSGHLWQINSFDQWGVELGKAMGAEIYEALDGTAQSHFEPNTNAIIEAAKSEAAKK